MANIINECMLAYENAVMRTVTDPITVIIVHNNQFRVTGIY